MTLPLYSPKLTRMLDVHIKRLPHCVGMPTQSSMDAAGWDVCAAIPDNEVWVLPTSADPTRSILAALHQLTSEGEDPRRIVNYDINRVLVPTGLSMAIPSGYEIQCRPRSGLALKHGIMIGNTPGTIDADYRGEINVILVNTDPQNAFVIRRGDRIAQLVFNQIETPRFIEADHLPSTGRGEGGFGSTGTR